MIVRSSLFPQKRANEVMKWRNNQRMKEKQAADQEVIAVKEAAHLLEYHARLTRKRALGRYKLRPEGPRQKMIQEDTHPTLSVLVKGTPLTSTCGICQCK